LSEPYKGERTMPAIEEAAPSGRVRSRSTWAIVALAFSLVGTAGSLSLSLGLGLKACPLCFYQRTFMMSTFAVLALGLAADRRQPCLYCLLSSSKGPAVSWGIS
jgi:disulfide bond formation protein DsbB